MQVRHLLTYLISLPKTIFFNFKCLPINQAIHLPIFVAYNVKLLNLKKNVISIETVVKFGLVRIGFSGTEIISSNRSLIDLKQGKVIFKGKSVITKGCTISVTGGTIILGNNFYANRNCFISCTDRLVVGNNVLLGWSVILFDSAGHTLSYDGKKKIKMTEEIVIGNHVWICAEAHLLKGSKIADGSVVAYSSLVTGYFVEKNCLIGGIPAKILRKGVSWEK